MINHNIQIDGLTLEQVNMLDRMWAIESYEQFTEWLDDLSIRERKMALLLKELIILELGEAEDPHPDTTQAINLLEKYML